MHTVRVGSLLLGVMLLSACPQLLDDRFALERSVTGAGGNGGGASGGSGDNAHAGDAGDVDGAGDRGTEPPPGPDLTAPSILGVTPADGARGVSSSARLEVRFSEPMDTAATSSAFASSELPPDQARFTWSANDSVLTIEPLAPFSVASGTDPSQVSAQLISFQLSSNATDRAGNPLPATSVSFWVERQINQTILAATDRSLTGNYREDGQYGVFDCEEADTSICIGDGISFLQTAYRGFLTFDLSSLPSDRLAIVAAQLNLVVADDFGDPFGSLGALQLETLAFDAIGQPAFEATAESALGVMSTGAVTGDTLSASVLGAVQADAAAGRRAQFRLRFDAGSDADGVADLIIVEQSGASLSLGYTMP